MIRGRVVCIIVFIVSIWSDLVCFVDDLCQILGMFSLNSIAANKGGPAGILREIQPTDVCIIMCLEIFHTERFEVNILTVR